MKLPTPPEIASPARILSLPPANGLILISSLSF
jgi:hypothetical protein